MSKQVFIKGKGMTLGPHGQTGQTGLVLLHGITITRQDR